MTRLVLLGGGHSHIEVLRRVAAAPLPAELVLIEPYPALAYSGMVPGVIAGTYDMADSLVDLLPLCARAGATLKRARATRIDASAKQVHCDDGSTVGYDVLSIDVGSTVDTSTPGAGGIAMPVRPLWRFAHAMRRVADAAAVAVVGAGSAGVELALALRAAGARTASTAVVTLIGDSDALAPGLAAPARSRLAEACLRHGVNVRLRSRVCRVTPQGVVLDDGGAIAAGAVVWATGPVPHGWLRDTGLPVEDRGFLAVDVHLRVGGREDIYAAGDAATVAGHPRPKAGVYAVRAAPVLAANLRAAVLGERPRAYRPQRRALALVGTADGRAVASYGPLAAEGAWVWRWKDAIDRRFVRRYRT